MGSACSSSNAIPAGKQPCTALGSSQAKEKEVQEVKQEEAVLAQAAPFDMAEENHRNLLQLDEQGWRSLLAKLEANFGRKKCNIAGTEHRAITLAHLRMLLKYGQEHCHTWRDTRSREVVSPATLNLYHFADWCIRPATLIDRCSMAELLVLTTSPPNFYISHWWGEPMLDFLACVEVHTQLRQLPPSTSYWVCAHANRQWDLNEELSKDPSDSSFYKAMIQSTGILLVLDTDGTPFTRIWCAYEIYIGLVASEQDKLGLLFDIATTKDHKAYLLTDGQTEAEAGCQVLGAAGMQACVAAMRNPRRDEIPEEVWKAADKQSIGGQFKALREMSFPDEVMELGFKVEAQKAAATSEADRRHILNKIAGREGEELDFDVRHDPEAVKAYKAVGLRIGSLMARAMWVKAASARRTRQLGLPALLAADQELEHMTFDLTSMLKAETYSARLIEDVGQSLHMNLKTLSIKLNFVDGESSEFRKAMKQPSRRRRCLALQGFLQQAPNLLCLSLDFFWWQDMVTDFELAALSLSIMGLKQLQQLSLTFSSDGVTERGLAALAHSLGTSTSLQHLSLAIGCASSHQIRLGIGGAALGHSLRGLSSLHSLSLAFSSCSIDSPDMAAVVDGTRKLSRLQQLHLTFQQCDVSGTPLASSVAAANADIGPKLAELAAQFVQRCDEGSNGPPTPMQDSTIGQRLHQLCSDFSGETIPEEDEAEVGAISFAALLFGPRGPWEQCLSHALSQCNSLSDFTLSALYSDIDDKRLKALGQALAELQHLVSLRVAVIASRHLTDKGVQAFLQDVSKPRQLRTLAVRFDQLANAESCRIDSVEELRSLCPQAEAVAIPEGAANALKEL